LHNGKTDNDRHNKQATYAAGEINRITNQHNKHKMKKALMEMQTLRARWL